MLTLRSREFAEDAHAVDPRQPQPDLGRRARAARRVPDDERRARRSGGFGAATDLPGLPPAGTSCTCRGSESDRPSIRSNTARPKRSLARSERSSSARGFTVDVRRNGRRRHRPARTAPSLWAAPSIWAAGSARRVASSTEHAELLARHPTWLFSSGPIGSPPHPAASDSFNVARLAATAHVRATISCSAVSSTRALSG